MTTRTHASTEHARNRIESVDGLHRLICQCGWRTSFTPSGAAIGEAWDRHRSDV